MYITGGPANFAIPVLAVARSLWRAYLCGVAWLAAIWKVELEVELEGCSVNRRTGSPKYSTLYL
jgi:hypothetical protein